MVAEAAMARYPCMNCCLACCSEAATQAIPTHARLTSGPPAHDSVGLVRPSSFSIRCLIAAPTPASAVGQHLDLPTLRAPKGSQALARGRSTWPLDEALGAALWRPTGPPLLLPATTSPRLIGCLRCVFRSRARALLGEAPSSRVTTRHPSRPSRAVSRILAASQWWVGQIAPRALGLISHLHVYQRALLNWAQRVSASARR